MKTKLNIELIPGQKIWFTSDLHFGHRNVIKFCHRPFEDIKDMRDKLISNWNNLVGDNDIVFILGDFCWFDSNTEIKKLLKQFKGQRIYLIPGNHDTEKGFRELPDNVELLDSIVTLWVTVPGEKTYELVLSHLPLMTWPHREHSNCYQFFGHIHSGPGVIEGEARMDQDLPLWPGKQYDIGVDNNEYCPVELHQVLEKLHLYI